MRSTLLPRVSAVYIYRVTVVIEALRIDYSLVPGGHINLEPSPRHK